MELFARYKQRCKYLKKIGLANEELNNFENFKDEFNQNEFQNILRLKQNRKNKRYRTKNKYIELNKISMCFEKPTIVFGTITLNDRYLKLKENTYIRNIHEWLKEHFVYSILNKDYGSKKGREHYHFIGLTTEKMKQCFKGDGTPVKSKKGYDVYNLLSKTYLMGHEPDLCIIDFHKNDLEQLINYFLKLNNHSNKDTTRSRVRIIKGPMMKLLEKKID